VINRKLPTRRLKDVALPPKKAAIGNVMAYESKGGDVSDQVSIIERKRDQLLAAIEGGKTPSSTITYELTTVMLQAMINLLPNLEKAANANSKGVYHLEKIAVLARDLQMDLRNMEDRNTMREKIMNGIVDPALLEFTNKNITELNRLRRLVSDDAEAVDFIESLKLRTHELVNGLHIRLSNDLDKYFGGTKDAMALIDHKQAEDNSDDYFEKADDSEAQYKAKRANRKR
jgi:hypothetical protein